MDENRPNGPEGQQPPPPEQPPVNTTEPAPPCRTSGMAIASLVLGILGLCTCVTALPGLILGIIALVQTSRNRECLRGQGLALAGTILSGIAVLLTPMFAAILFPVFARARDKAQQTCCMDNAKQLSAALMMYEDDWDNRYPLAANWNEALAKYVKPGKSPNAWRKESRPWVCPAAKNKTEPSYAMNDKLSGIEESKINFLADTVAIYESESGRNQADGPGLFPNPPRHREGHAIGFADGHVKMVGPYETTALIWDPAATPPPAAETGNTKVAPPSG